MGVSLSDTAVAMVAEFSQKSQKADEMGECLSKTQERGDVCRWGSLGLSRWGLVLALEAS